jgi:MFS family permease
VSNEINKLHDPYAALRIRDFSVYLIARFCLTLGVQIQGVVVGIQIYKLTPGSITDKALCMGYIGLAEAIPFITLAIFAGHIADVVRRKKILLFSIGFLLICSWSLFSITSHKTLLLSLGTLPIYGIIFCTGIARGFLGPVFPAFLSQLIPRTLYANASTWNSNLWQTAAVLGPALGGLLLGIKFNIQLAYGVCSTLMTLSFLTMLFVKNHPLPPREKKEKLKDSLTAGIRFVFGNQIMLSALCLDLFAVLFGGAVAMIPIFTHDILHLGVDADKFVGYLRAAPAAGSILMGLVMAYFPPTKKAGRNLFIAVMGFGLCIIGFAFSTNVYLSMLFLLMSGAFDMVSVIIRHTILQLMTPDDMRGRVSAVNGIFIGSSNEIGEMESGLTAKLFGVIPSVAFGGFMTIAVVGSVMFLAPKLRKLNLDEHV